MAKKKKTAKRQPKKELESVLSSDEERFDEQNTDVESDESDETFFKMQKDYLMFNDDGKSDENLSEVEEEVMPFGNDQDEDEDEDEFNSFYAIKAQKDEMESDFEDEDEDDIPTAEAWGKKKSTYYNTDYVDKDFRKYSQEEEELAIAEEEEALETQKRLLSDVNDADLGFELYEKSNKNVALEEPDTLKKLEIDLSALKNNEKRKLLENLSPELRPLMNDFTNYLLEAKEKLEPMLAKANEEQNGTNSQRSTDFILAEMKYNLILRYAMNISFYMALKCNDTNAKTHPVVKRLVTYKRLLKELENSVSLGNEMVATKRKLQRKENAKKEELMKKHKLLNDHNKPTKKVKLSDENEDYDYDDDEDDGDEEYVEGEENSVNGEAETQEDKTSKRGITYQMAKNKGLTPKKKKELRNPRVKHRTKYKKAIVKRKGQVKLPRKELKKYSGEISGIRSSVVKSVKFK